MFMLAKPLMTQNLEKLLMNSYGVSIKVFN